MHPGLSRRVRHPLGVSEWFPVDRGVAQRAVESPLVYTCFIDGLARELKAAGHGVWVAGTQIPLLMYADDIVLMAASQSELARMSSIVSEFARRNRFEFNGKKKRGHGLQRLAVRKSKVLVLQLVAVRRAGVGGS